MLDVIIRPIEKSDLRGVKKFCDRAIGTNYYSHEELEEIFRRSHLEGDTCSFVVEGEGQIKGIRFSFPPGQWHKGKGKGLSPDLWRVPLESVGYFQSLFLDDSLQGQGLGKRVSLASIERLKRMGAKAIVTHCWLESPHDSSRKYLQSLGFEFVARHPLYWHEVDYTCTRCGKPCMCTADEMILRF